jgi:hypothetical protein
VPRFWEAELAQLHHVPGGPRNRVARRRHRAGWVEPLTIDASHSPFLSRPAELAQLLVDATTTVPVGPLKPNG